MSNRKEQLAALDRLLTIMDELRAQCPWDRKQTFESLRHLTIEETYELADAILEKDSKSMEGELGDLLLHIFFYAKIGSESQSFDIASIAHSISEKLINRHPHIYGDIKVADEEEVKRNWEQLKLKEGKESVLSGVPNSLPALIKASRIQDKVAGVGFDWEASNQVLDKVKEELDELSVEVTNKDQDAIEAEFGDVLFSMINYARFLGVDAESALERTNKKFIKRFKYLEQQAKSKGQNLKAMTLEEMDRYWQEAKNL